MCERAIHFSFEAVMRSVATNNSGGSGWRSVKETPAKRLWKGTIMISGVDDIDMHLELLTTRDSLYNTHNLENNVLLQKLEMIDYRN